MDKDELSELLISEDKELRKLGISLLINNFYLPEKLYYIFNKDGEYCLGLYPQKDSFSFSLNKKDYLNWIERQFVSKEQKKVLLSAIFKYNEEDK